MENENASVTWSILGINSYDAIFSKFGAVCLLIIFCLVFATGLDWFQTGLDRFYTILNVSLKPAPWLNSGGLTYSTE